MVRQEPAWVAFQEVLREAELEARQGVQSEILPEQAILASEWVDGLEGLSDGLEDLSDGLEGLSVVALRLRNLHCTHQ